MDRKLSQHQEIERLIRLSAASRACLTSELVSIKQRFDFPARILGSLKTHPFGWLFGSLASGFVGSSFFRRKPAITVTKRRGLLVTLLGLAVAAARPFAKVWLADHAKSYLIGRLGNYPVNRPRSQARSINPV